MAGSLVLAVSMLVYSGFSAITTMECFTSGTKTVKVVPEESCCKAEAIAISTVYAKCCDVEKSEVTFYSYKVELTDFDVLPVLASFVSVTKLPELFAYAKHWFTTAPTHAPPISGRNILIQICKYTI